MALADTHGRIGVVYAVVRELTRRLLEYRATARRPEVDLLQRSLVEIDHSVETPQQFGAVETRRHQLVSPMIAGSPRRTTGVNGEPGGMDDDVTIMRRKNEFSVAVDQALRATPGDDGHSVDEPGDLAAVREGGAELVVEERNLQLARGIDGTPCSFPHRCYPTPKITGLGKRGGDRGFAVVVEETPSPRPRVLKTSWRGMACTFGP